MVFYEWLFTNSASRRALHRLRSANSALSVASQAQLFRSSFKKELSERAFKKSYSRIALHKEGVIDRL
ncbi:MAG: hypothetical protein CMQ23_06895 [Gammaproteobacteria bacterium]|nr:hypothetical protein [Gammaproteobacteria bacterium]